MSVNADATSRASQAGRDGRWNVVHRLGLHPALRLRLTPALLWLLTPALLLLLGLPEHVALLTRPSAAHGLLRLHGPRLGLRHGCRRLSRLRRLRLLSHWSPNRGQPNRAWEG